MGAARGAMSCTLAADFFYSGIVTGWEEKIGCSECSTSGAAVLLACRQLLVKACHRMSEAGAAMAYSLAKHSMSQTLVRAYCFDACCMQPYKGAGLQL
eukprot:1152079-Pelagomonas_calceolata.AAC.9